MARSPGASRVFKTAWFVKAARKAGIGDDELCRAVKQAQAGQCDDLPTYLFAKKDRANIDAAELATFRELAKGYEKLTAAQLTELLTARDLEEICHGDQA